MFNAFQFVLHRKESVHSSSSEETRSGAGVGGGVGVGDEMVKSLMIPRSHKRSQSSMGEENPIPPGPGPLQRRMYVSSTLHGVHSYMHMYRSVYATEQQAEHVVGNRFTKPCQ